MQTLTGVVPFAIVLLYLTMQTLWLIIGRISRDRYLRDIMSFRTPTSALSRYYGWRVENSANGIVEGFVLVFVLIIVVIGLGLVVFTIDLVIQSFPIIVFVVLFSLLSTAQQVWRVKEIIDKETRIVTSIKTSNDKIGVAKSMVDELYDQGALGDGRTWFALFKLAQKRDQTGWAIKDVLIEKGKEEDIRIQEPSKDTSSTDSGPEIS
ncbi:hypothetical protein EU527_04475 [Candidatus Thorarchaeota archaeon]|nr:MAG: hypothetical protein EU527_04475 [Candidatus Thorarchaeota archaeon]